MTASAVESLMVTDWAEVYVAAPGEKVGVAVIPSELTVSVPLTNWNV
jgi:hypothetical protein